MENRHSKMSVVSIKHHTFLHFTGIALIIYFFFSWPQTCQLCAHNLQHQIQRKPCCVIPLCNNTVEHDYWNSFKYSENISIFSFFPLLKSASFRSCVVQKLKFSQFYVFGFRLLVEQNKQHGVVVMGSTKNAGGIFFLPMFLLLTQQTIIKHNVN